MSNDTNQHGLTDDELGGRLRRAAWSLFLIGPLGALIGGAMKNKPKPPDVTSPPAGRWRQRPVFGGLAKVPRDQFRALAVPIPSGC